MLYFCCDERRRSAVLDHSTLNGIDFLEVKDDPADPPDKRQRTLFLHFLKDLGPGQLKKENIRIDGGERIKGIAVTSAAAGATSPPSSPPTARNVLIVVVSEAGDFSTYTLSLVQDATHSDPPVGFDPILSSVDFSFKIACPSDFDCRPLRICPPDQQAPPPINYLAKDYESFRQLMLDRMALLTPRWSERNAADIGITLVELLAYVGDYLSYRQDAIGTEAYLGTASLRSSVRRHARLVDYPMHDGRNSRLWAQVLVNTKISLTKGEGRDTTKLLTKVAALPAVIKQDSAVYEKAITAKPQVFELLQDNIALYPEHNEIEFYAWGDRECCLAKGSTRATLKGDLPNLKKGDVLIFIEVNGPGTGVPEDADPTHRCAVRLTNVVHTSDPLGGLFEDPPNKNPVAVTSIEWDTGDALPFALCISAKSGTAFFPKVSVALGNIVLADNGLTFTDEPETPPLDTDSIATSLDPDTVPNPDPALTEVSAATGSRCQGRTSVTALPRYRPRLKQEPLTQAPPYDPANPPATATATMTWDPSDHSSRPLPAITLLEPAVKQVWEPVYDLLASKPIDRSFVVEVESDGAPYLRFGDDILGEHPAPGTKFQATYRIGNGAAGNIGRDKLAHIVSSNNVIASDPANSPVIGLRNPLPAVGGIDQESNESVRQNAPAAFRVQERAVTAGDYQEVGLRCDLGIQRLAATFRWTGSWRTVFITPDRIGGLDVDPTFKSQLLACLERYRMAGQDLDVDSPDYVSLDVDMTICVKREYFASDVKAALLMVLSNRVLPDGRRGVFHPDNFSFGQTIYLSPIYAAAQAADGVESVVINKFQPVGVAGRDAAASGELDLNRLEIARLDNDPNFPERGVLTLQMLGGR